MKALPSLLIALAGFAAGIAVDRASHTSVEPAGEPGRREQPDPRRLAPTGARGSGGSDRANAGGGESGAPADLFAGSIDDLRQLAAAGGGSQSQRNRLQEALGRATPSDLRRLADELQAAGGNGPADRELRMVLYRRLAEVDPAAALSAVLDGDEVDFQIKSAVVRTAFAALARQDFSSAEAALGQLTNRELRHEALGGISEAIAEGEPLAMARLIDSLPDGHHYDGFFRNWAMRDAAAASAYVLSVEGGQKREEWIRSVASGWAVADPDVALGWAGSLESASDRLRATHGIVAAIARTDPARAAALIGELPAGGPRRDMIETLAANWAQQDALAALTWAGNLEGALRATAVGEVLRRWAEMDPAAASGYVQTLPTSERSLETVQQVARHWAESDRAAAFAWADTLDDPSSRERALGGVASVWANDDPQGAAQFAVTLAPGQERQGVLDDVARRWSSQDPAAALGWASELPVADRVRATRAIMEGMANRDPLAAATVYAQLESDLPQDREMFKDIAGEIAGRWSGFDPATAAAWAAGLDDADAQRRAVGEVAQHWVRADAGEASQWISQLPPGPVRDAAARQLVEHITGSDPDAAFQWAMSVGEDGGRNGLVRHVLERWSATDPQAAQSSLDRASSLSPEQRQELGEVFR